MTKRQDLYLQRRSRPEQSDQRQANQPANISHQPRASPDSTSLASRIEFPTMTPNQSMPSALLGRKNLKPSPSIRVTSSRDQTPSVGTLRPALARRRARRGRLR